MFLSENHSMNQYSTPFLKLSNIPLYGYALFYLRSDSLDAWVVLPLATVSNAAHPFSILLDTHLGVELLGHVVILFSFLKTCRMFSTAAARLLFPPAVFEGSDFRTSSSTRTVFCFV